MSSPGNFPIDSEAVLMGGMSRDFTDSSLITSNGHTVGALKMPLSGAMLVSCSHGHWVIGTGSVFWIPPNTAYKARMLGKVSLRTLYLNPTGCGRLPSRSGMMRASRLTQELIAEAAVSVSPLPDRRVSLLTATLLEELCHNGTGMPETRAPRDSRLVRICTHIQQYLDDNKTLQEWAAEVGCDTRTLYRLFIQELGMPFLQWRQHVRLQAALDWLAAGKPVFDVAFDLGYQNQSAFTTMFKRNIGMAPSEFARAFRGPATIAAQ